MNITSFENIQHALEADNPTLLGTQPVFHDVMDRYVVYHKQIEKRMDGSSGGAYRALIETVVKEGYYFTGTAFDENLHLHHVVTNDPEEIAAVVGFKPVSSDCCAVFQKIKTLLSEGEKVLFCGTPLQCFALQSFVVDTEKLITVDLINTPFVVQELLDKYAKELGEVNGAKVTDVRFYNKEFYDEGAKRITLENGRVVFTRSSDSFDSLMRSGRFTKRSEAQDIFKSIQRRVADITLGAYRMDSSDDDGLGFAYLGINTTKGSELFSKAQKRLVIVKSNADIKDKSIKFQSAKVSNSVDLSSLKSKSLKELTEIPSKGILRRIKKRVAPFYNGFRFARHNLRAYLQFIKLNFLTKGVKVDYEHNGFIYISPHCAFKLVDGFQIELHGPLNIGPRRIKSSKQESRLRMEKGAKITVYEHCAFGAGSNVEIYKNALLEVGDLQSNAELNIICGEHIILGTPVNIARNATVRDTSGHLIATPGYHMTKPITIGNHVWVCTESTVMPGVSIGDGAIVGACSFVTKKVKPFTMVQGNPAVEVGTIKYFRI